MVQKILKESMFLSNLGWLESRFHFSFAEYRDFKNMNFGVLRVLNDDIVDPHTGFDMHPHSDMEIISYVVQGEITHKDSMGNVETLKRGEVQYMSAGTGVMHSEHNKGNEDLRLLQIWILPPVKGIKPLYGSHAYNWKDRENKLLNIVSSQSGNAQIKIYQDVNIYVAELEEQKDVKFVLNENRQIYFVQIEGSSIVNDVTLNAGDALKIIEEPMVSIQANKVSHFLFIEMNM